MEQAITCLFWRTETVAVYRYLLASYDQGEKQYLLAQILNHLNIGFPQLLFTDRLNCHGLIDLYEEEVGITIQLHAHSEGRTIFSNAVFKRLLEKKDWGKRQWRICFQHAPRN